MSYRETGWYDVQCTSDGKFRRNGREMKPRSSKYNGSPYIVVKSKGSKPKQKNAAILVAMAWHNDWEKGYNIIPKDGNPNNICLNNLHVADCHEFASYKAGRRNNPNAGAVDWSKYGVFKNTSVDGLECTIDGIFRRNNRIVPLIKGSRRRGAEGLFYVKYMDANGRSTTTTAARLVAKTWSPQTWFEDCIISYKDGNPRNIHSDNLILLDEHKYHVARGKMVGKGNMCDFDKAFSIVERRAREAQIALRYFRSGCMDELNEYVRTELLSLVEDYVDSLGRPGMKRDALQGVFSILYDWVLCYRPLTNYFVFCKKLARTYIKTGNFGIYDIPPKPIVRERVSQFNLDSLCKKYKCVKME